MPKTNVRIGNEKRSLSKGSNIPEDLNPLDGARPLSLQMGPTLIWLNALGDIEARAITEAWRPRFMIKTVTSIEEVPWQ